MQDNGGVLEIFDILKRIKKVENFKMGIKSREEMIDYIVEQMERVEKLAPQMVEYVEYDFEKDFGPERR